MSYINLPGIITWGQSWDTSFKLVINDGVAPLEATLTLDLTDGHAYGETSAGVADSDTLCDNVADQIAAASWSGGITATIDSKTYTTSGSSYCPTWSITFTLSDSQYVTAQLDPDPDALTDLGIYINPLAGAYGLTHLGGGQHRLTSNGFPKGIWAPGVPAQWFATESQIVRVSRSPFDASERTIVRLGERSGFTARYDIVPLAHRHQDHRSVQAQVERAGMTFYDSSQDDVYGSLEQLLEGFAVGNAGRFHTAQGTYYAVDLQEDGFSLDALCSDGPAAGAYQTVSIPLVKTA